MRIVLVGYHIVGSVAIFWKPLKGGYTSPNRAIWRTVVLVGVQFMGGFFL